MTVTPGIPQNLIVQSGNQNLLISWDLSPGATSYIIQRSLDNVNFTPLVTVSGTPLATQYVDTAVVLGTQYYYQVAAANSVGSINFTGQPNNTDLATIANINFVALTGPATGFNFQIGTTVSQTIANFATVVNRNIPGLVVAQATATQLLLYAYPGVSQLASTMTNTTATAFTMGGISAYTASQSGTPVPAGERTLGQLRLAAMQRADRVNSNFVTKSEWNQYLNLALFELYDLLITTYEDLYVATPVQFVADGTTFLYPLPNGSNMFLSGLNPQVTLTPRPFYKLIGVDLALQNATNAYVTINKFNFSDRNTYIFPNSASTIYGVFNLRYRLLGLNQIEFIPTPSAGQSIRLWYIPRMKELLLDTDTTDTGISGWIEYAIVKAAYYALTKEESDTTSLVMQLVALQKRIEETAVNRDAGLPETISDVASTKGSGFGGTGFGWGGGIGGFGAMPLLPFFISGNQTNKMLTYSELIPKTLLGYVAFTITFAYFSYLHSGKFRSWISLAFKNSKVFIKSSSAFFNTVKSIVSRSSDK